MNMSCHCVSTFFAEEYYSTSVKRLYFILSPSTVLFCLNFLTFHMIFITLLDFINEVLVINNIP